MARSRVYLVASPIGDQFGDFSIAALRVIEELTHLFAEADDGFVARMRERGLIKPIHRVHFLSGSAASPGEQACVEEARRLVAAGESFAILASSGIPCFVDPGHEVVDMLLSEHVDDVELIPVGMSSALDAMLTLGGHATRRFLFLGHVPGVHSVEPALFAHRFPVVYYVHGPALGPLFEQLRALDLELERVLILKDVRKRTRARLFLRQDLELPAELVFGDGVDCVVLIAQRLRH